MHFFAQIGLRIAAVYCSFIAPRLPTFVALLNEYFSHRNILS